jgi:hypothetical protein
MTWPSQQPNGNQAGFGNRGGNQPSGWGGQQQPKKQYPESFPLGGEDGSAVFIGDGRTPVVTKGVFTIRQMIAVLEHVESLGFEKCSLRQIQMRDKPHLAVTLVCGYTEEQAQGVQGSGQGVHGGGQQFAQRYEAPVAPQAEAEHTPAPPRAPAPKSAPKKTAAKKTAVRRK